MRKLNVAFGILAIAILGSCTKSLKEQEPITETASSSRSSSFSEQAAADHFVPNELLVKFKKGAAGTARSKALERIGGNVSEKIQTKAMERLGDEGFVVVRTPFTVEEAIAKLRGGAEIEFAEPNYIYTHGAATDPQYTNGTLWGMKGGIGFNGSNAEAAWAAGHTGSKSVYVGIIDEGIQYTHPDLDGQVWANPYDPVDGVDNDRNGYVDDRRGWDFDGNNNEVYDGGNRGSQDDHGTHVAGTIGAKANGSGVVGVNWNVTLISGKFLGRRGGTTANAIKAVDYFTDLKTRHGLNIVATNNSWGGGGYSQALFDAIQRANAAGILFIAAAGNGGSDGVGDNNDAVASYPSGYNLANVIAVASITSTGALSRFSNFGATSVDIGAPGSGIMSTTAFDLYETYSGTSMATPHVTGAAALYKSVNPGATAAQIKNALLSSAVPTGSLSGKTVTGGRLDANAALSR